MCQTHRSPFLPSTKGHNWDIWTLSLDFKRFLRALQIKEEYFLTESFYALQIFVSNIFLSHMSTWHVSAWWDSPTDCALAVVMVGTRSHHIPAKWHRGGALVLHCIRGSLRPSLSSGHVVKLVTDATADQQHCYPGKSKTDTKEAKPETYFGPCIHYNRITSEQGTLIWSEGSNTQWRSNDNAAAQSGVKTGKWAKVGDNTS